MAGEFSSGGADARYERERAFHDARVEDDNARASARKYYAVDSARHRYWDLLRTVPPGARVLEYGCGTGSSAFDLAAQGAEILGIDISPKAVEEAQRSAQERGLDSASFEVMNAEALTVSDASVDVVCGSGILHHLDLSRSLAEVRRVLRPQGFAVFVEPLGTNPVINTYRRLTPNMRTADEHPLVPADFELMRTHFSSVEVEYHNGLSLAGVGLVRVGAGDRTIQRLRRMDSWLFQRSGLARRMAWMSLIVLRP